MDLAQHNTIVNFIWGIIEAFFKREVLPYVPDAWIDESKTQIGYEVSFTRYFYKPVQMRTLEEIMVAGPLRKKRTGC